MTRGYAVQIIDSKRGFKLIKAVLELIFCDPRLIGLPIVILCIAGAARKGKSFLLNFFLDYLIHKENNPDTPWKLENGKDLEGFEFQDGEDRTTVGIWAWNHVFVINDSDGNKIAVALIDSQGTFDNKTKHEDCSTIFGMTCMFSSIMSFNVFNDLQEDKLDNLVVFINHCQMINENLGGSGKLLQDLVFFVRDFQFMKKYNGKDGGKQYIEKVLGPCDVPHLQETRNTINASADKVHCFVLPHPGKDVAYDKTSKIEKMDPDFVANAEHAVSTLFSKLQLHKKKIGASIIHCEDMPKYMELCFQTFDDNQHFAPKAAHTVNREFMVNLEVQRAIDTYETNMRKDLEEYDTGCPEKDFQAKDELYNAKIEADITKRIRNEEICTKIIKAFNEKRKGIFEMLAKQNKTVLDFEKKKAINEAKFAETEARFAASEERYAKEKEEQQKKLDKHKRESEIKFAKNEAKFAETEFRITSHWKILFAINSILRRFILLFILTSIRSWQKNIFHIWKKISYIRSYFTLIISENKFKIPGDR